MHKIAVAMICTATVSGCIVESAMIPNDLGCTNNVFESSLDGIRYNIEPNDSDAILVMLHGGAWASGTKDKINFYRRSPNVMSALANFDVYSIEYTLWHSTDTAHPLQMSQVANFINSIDTEGKKVCLLGHSAGAQIAASIAFSGEAEIDCLVLSGGTYDFESITAENGWVDSVSALALEYKADSQQQPDIDGNAGSSMPVMVSYGQNDRVVPASQSKRLIEQLRSTGADVLEHSHKKSHRFTLFGGCNANNGSQEFVDFISQVL